jgi:hypothetical protein
MDSQLQDYRKRLHDLSSELMSSNLLNEAGSESDIREWVESEGSPVHYVRAAAEYLKGVVEGTPYTQISIDSPQVAFPALERDHMDESPIWDPTHSRVNREVWKNAAKELETWREGLGELSELTEQSLLSDAVPEDVSREWFRSPGSPVYYMKSAAAYLAVAAEGGICYDQYPWSHFNFDPPDRWCCGHTPQQHYKSALQ